MKVSARPQARSVGRLFPLGGFCAGKTSSQTVLTGCRSSDPIAIRPLSFALSGCPAYLSAPL